jgi:hypothetical protein
MEGLPATLAANREGIDVYIDLARGLDPDRWTTPVQPGSWSPAQITDHLTRTYDFGCGVIQGTVTGAPLPRIMRWFIRRFWLKPALRNGRFIGKSRGPKFFEPSTAGGTPEELLPRLRAAGERFAELVERQTGRGVQEVEHPMFGRVPLVDFLRLQVIHVQHHRAQLPAASS